MDWTESKPKPPREGDRRLVLTPDASLIVFYSAENNGWLSCLSLNMAGSEKMPDADAACVEAIRAARELLTATLAALPVEAR